MNEILQKRIDEAAENHDNYPDKYAYNKAGFIAGAKYYAEHQWVSVEDELPEIKEHFTSDLVLVECANKALCLTRYKVNMFGQGWFDCEECDEDEDMADWRVIHWMSIPKLNKD